MTKLTQWLSAIIVFLSFWYMLITNKIETPFTKRYMSFVIYSPVILVVLFGLYAVTVVLYRVFTFNNCEKAALELQNDIKIAKEDLKAKGYVF